MYKFCFQCLHVPYTSLTMYITTKQKDRDMVTFIRKFIAWAYGDEYCELSLI